MSHLTQSVINHIYSYLLHRGIFKSVNNPSIQKNNSRPQIFPGYYKFLYWVYLIPFIILLFFVSLLTIGSQEQLQKLWFATDLQTIIVYHSDWPWIFKFVAMLGAAPLSVAIYYPFAKFIFSDRFLEYVDLRIYSVSYLRASKPWINEINPGDDPKKMEEEVFSKIDVGKLRQSYRPMNIFFGVLFVIGLIAYILSINSYTQITPNQIVIHDFWRIQSRSLSYDQIKTAKLTYETDSKIFWPGFILEFNGGQSITIWDTNKDLEEQDFATVIKYLRARKVSLEATPLKSFEVTEDNQKYIERYKNFEEMITTF